VIAENEESDGRGAAAGILSAVVNVTVRVQDVNDNHPIIIVPPTNSSDDSIGRAFDVCRRARPGDRVLRVVASDADSGPNARLRYLLMDGDHQDATSSSSSYFSLSADDGWLVASQDLDQLTVGQRFLFTVVVTDDGRPPLSTNRTMLLAVNEQGFRGFLFQIAPFMLSFSIFSDVSALVPFCPAHCYFTHCLHLHYYNSLPDYLKSFYLSFNCFRQQLKHFVFCKY